MATFGGRLTPAPPPLPVIQELKWTKAEFAEYEQGRLPMGKPTLEWSYGDLDAGWERVGYGHGVQGNLDPAVLLGPVEGVVAGTRRVLRQAGGRPGHVFNLGHGVLPGSTLENLQALVETVREGVAVNA